MQERDETRKITTEQHKYNINSDPALLDLL